jgi:hypothetical protein
VRPSIESGGAPGASRHPTGRRSLALLLAASCALAALAVAIDALPPPAGAQEQAQIVGQTPLEQEAYDLYVQEQMIGARTKAEEVLARNADSILGHFVLGCVLYQAEGSLARGMYHLGRARELYETRYAANVRPAGAPWALHRETLFQIQSLAGQMELYDYQLQVLGYHDYLYDPDLLGEHAWPFMHLARFDEARDFANRAIKTRDAYQQSLGRNALCAVEGEARTRDPYFEACKNAYDAAVAERATGAENAVAVHAYNAALGAMAAGRWSDARELLNGAAGRLEHTPANPWRLLVRMNLDEGKIQDAAAGLNAMQRWRKAQPAPLRDQDRAETEVAFATVLLVAGESEAGLRLVDRAIAQPDRRGLVSSNQEQALGAHALLRRALARVQAERTGEEASARGIAGRFGGIFEVAGAHAGSWPDDERIRSVLSDDDRLVATLRLYVHGGIEPVPVWLVGDLIDVLGAGVVAVALNLARGGEGEDRRMSSYYDALEAEVRLHQGDENRALTLAQQALEHLPEREALLRARTMIVAAEAARQTGRDATALDWYEQVIALDAGALRRMDVAIPASTRHSGGGLAEDAAERLGRSPRVRDDPGFQVLVTQTTESGRHGLEACLLTQHGNRLSCASVQRQDVPVDPDAEVPDAGPARPGTPAPEREMRPETDDELVRRACAEFHRVVFAPAVSLGSIDMRSLDGRVTTGQEVARERLQNLLGGAIDGQ